MDIRLGLTFDDVLLQPGESDVLPESQADTSAPCHARDQAQHPDPLVGDGYRDGSRHGDRHGAAGRHRRAAPQPDDRGAGAAVRAVKRFESGMVVNPITITPIATLADAQDADGRRIASAAFRWWRTSGKLVGILTNRDVRFAENPAQPVAS
jgi:IMP dehydrogenase